jgi:hypothetical protein
LANLFEIQVKAILESVQIQKELDKIQANLKPISIKFDTGAAGGMKSTGADIQNVTQNAEQCKTALDGMRLAREKIVNGVNVSQTYKSESAALDQTVTVTGKAVSAVSNYDSALKRSY